jgi:hypothetical protein
VRRAWARQANKQAWGIESGLKGSLND